MTFSFALGSYNINSRYARRVRPVPQRRNPNQSSSLLSRITQIGSRARSEQSSRQRTQEANARALFEVPSLVVCLSDNEEPQDYAAGVVLPALPYKELERTPLKRQGPLSESPSSTPSATSRIGGAVRTLKRKLSLSKDRS